ncbi:MAG: STAS/SEC14 domain-containing protein [Deltaproteobacteria bacterium]|nr:STAS/SEC14 domain-containing protein [Deltaproteobacteria bacterium]
MSVNGNMDNMDSSENQSLDGLVDREKYIYHKNIKILVHDYSNLTGESAVHTVTAHADAVIRRGERNLVMLVDVTDAFADREVLAAFKRNWARNTGFFNKTAVVGAQGVVRFFLDLVNRFANTNALAFDEEQEALDWLVE